MNAKSYQHHQQQIQQQRIYRCGIHAAEFIKFENGSQTAQNTATKTARYLVRRGESGARSIYLGYKAGHAIHQIEK